MIDNLILIARAVAIYGATGFFLARTMSGRSIYENALVTIIMVHFLSYIVFLFHFIFNVQYSPISSLFIYGLCLLSCRFIFSPKGCEDKPSSGTMQPEEKRTLFIFSVLLLFFFIMYFNYSYKLGGGGGVFHAYLNLWKFNHETGFAFPDVWQIGYSSLSSVLFFPPLFFPNCLIVTCGVHNFNHAISGFGIVHFTSFAGVIILIHLLLKELTGYNRFSFFALLLVATWQKHPAASFHFGPDHNSFVGIFVLASIYYIIILKQRHDWITFWLLAASSVLGIGNRIWLAGFFVALYLMFADQLIIFIRDYKKYLFRARAFIAFSLLIFVGGYWNLAVYKLGSSENPYGVYHRFIEKNYGITDTGHFYSLDRLLFGASDIIQNIISNVSELYFHPHFGHALPKYLTILGVLGIAIWIWRYHKLATTWRLIIVCGLGLYLTGFISAPSYPRSYLWLTSILLFFATLLFSELCRLVPNQKRFVRLSYLFSLGVTIYIYSVFCFFLIITPSKYLIKSQFIPGIGPFFEDVASLQTGRNSMNEYASAIQSKIRPGAKILHTTAEPGIDLDAAVAHQYWWENYYFFPGVMGDDFMESVFPDFKEKNNVSPLALAKKDISVIDVTTNFNALVTRRNWTERQRQVLYELQGWILKNPDIFEDIAEGPAGRKAYFVNREALLKKYSNSSYSAAGARIIPTIVNR